MTTDTAIPTPVEASSAEGVAADRLKSFIERIERVREEIADLKSGEKEIFAELKGEGYDAKAVREILKQRMQDRDERQEAEAILETYKRALGMS